MMRKLIVLFLFALAFEGCRQAPFREDNSGNDNAHLLMATLWFQQADECRALFYQAYNLARLRLDEELDGRGDGARLAIVVDIDETVLDNSPFEGYCIENNTHYPEGWSEWVNLAKARALPGAVEFLQYASGRGVSVFYISNRKTSEMQATIQNLQEVGFPFADSLHLLLRSDESNKESRRAEVSKTHRIVLLLGDNLNDFTDLYEGTLPIERRQITDSLRGEFGRRFIVLPNPMYGDWESALFHYNRKLTVRQKDSVRRALIESFQVN